MGFKDVIFDMDSKLVVEAFKAPHLDSTAIVQHCKQIISSFCQNSHVEFTRRRVNMIAHSLSKVYDDVTTCIESLIFNEMN